MHPHLSNLEFVRRCGTTRSLISLVAAAIISLQNGQLPAQQAVAEQPPALQQLIGQVDDAVVLITTYDAVGRKNGLGSGFMIDKSGLVATNYHVIRNAARASVQFRSGKKGEIKGYRAIDKKLDLAILELDDVKNKLDVFDIEGAATPVQGERVIAIGHPSGFRFTVTTGIVSAIRKTKDLPSQVRGRIKAPDDSSWIQTNAAISGGNSGGPLLNAKGQVLGINTWIVPGLDLGFAISVEHLRPLAKKLSEKPESLPVPGSIIGPGKLHDRVKSVVDNYSRRYEEFVFRVRRASNRQEAQRIAKEQDPTAGFVRDLVKIADENSGEQVAYHALVAACMMGRGNTDAIKKELATAVEQLKRNHITERGLDAAIVALTNLKRPEVRPLCRTIIADSPHRELQALACFYLSTSLLQTKNPPSADLAEAKELLQLIMKDYKDVELLDTKLEKIVKPRLFGVTHLRIGSEIPEIEGQDGDGKPLKLSDYRGKVVLLDFWTDVNKYCRAMYPYKRLLMEKYKNRPFAVLGVNCDEEDQYRRLIDEGKVTWPNWHDGRRGPVVRRWGIARLPTIIVLDENGVIRFANLREKGLDLVIERLVSEIENGLPDNLVSAGTVWDFQDDGSKPNPAWNGSGFDSSRWHAGFAPLGYGDGDEATVVGFGSNTQNKHVTTYFRREFEVKDKAEIKDLVLSLWCDDGAAVYINGQEVARHNLPSSALTPTTKARGSVKDDGGKPHFFRVDPELLVDGKNAIAAEVHQANRTSSDLTFDLSLGTNVSDEVARKVAAPN